MRFDPIARAANGSFARFCVVGTGGFLIDAGLLFFLVDELGMGAFTGRVVSIMAAMTATWALNRRWTFRPTARHRAVEWGRYVAANLIGAGVNYAAYTATLLLVAGVPLMVAVCIGTGAGLAVNYFGSRYVVFGNR